MDQIRRDMLAGGGAALAGLLLPGGAAAREEPSLRETGASAGILYGLCEPATQFPGNRAYVERLAAECSLIVPSNNFMWRSVQPARESFDFTHLDLMAKFAAERDLGIVGHTLFWYVGVPKWLGALEGRRGLQEAMARYVEKTVGRYKGRMVRWDVINEQINPKDGLDGGLRRTPYLEALGPDYLKFAFAKAREVDPDVVLCYNEYGFEHRKEEERTKRDALIALLRKFRDDKVEVDCVGFQSHLSGDDEIDIEGLSAFTREVVGLGYKIAITELDVRDTNLPADPGLRDKRVARKVKDYLGCVMAEAKPITITNWGYTDDRSWYQYYDWSRRSDGAPLRPLAFDAAFRRKEQWQVIADAIRNA